MKKAGRFAFLGAYLAITLGLHAGDVWNRHFSESGSLYLFYNLGRVAFFLYLAWITQAIGAEALDRLARHRGWAPEEGPESGHDAGDRVLAAFFAGASLLTLTVFVLGYLKLYYFPVALAGTGLVVYRSHARFRAAADRARSWLAGLPAAAGALTAEDRPYVAALALLAVMVAVEAALAFLSSGLFVDLSHGGDSFGHYLPYYREVLQNHGIWMNPYFLHYFYSKGAGLQFLAILLTDLQSAQLASFLFLGLAAFTLVQLMRRICGHREAGRPLAWALFAAVVLLATEIRNDGFSKLHETVGAYFFFILYATSLPVLSRRLQACLYLVLAAITVSSPLYAPFVIPMLVFQAAFSRLRNEAGRPRTLVILAVAATLFTFALLGWNYLTSGMVEAVPLGLFLKHRNQFLMSRWIDPAAVLFQETFNGYFADFSSAGIWDKLKALGPFSALFFLRDPSFIGAAFAEFPFLVFLLAMAALVILRIRRSAAAFGAEVTDFLLPILMMPYLVALFGVVFPVEKHARYFSFLYPIKAAVYVSGFYLVYRALSPLLKGARFPLRGLLAFAILLGPAAISFHSFLGEQERPLEAASRRFFLGELSYRDAYRMAADPGVYDFCLEIGRAAGPEARIAILNFVYECYGLPGARIERPFMTGYDSEMSTVMFSPAEAAMAALRRHGIDFVALDVSRPVISLAHAPLFQPEALRKYFKPVWASQAGFLMTWRGPQDPPLPEDWVTALSTMEKAGRADYYGKTYESVRAALPTF